MENAMRTVLRVFALIAVFFWALPSLAEAQPVSPPPNPQQNFTPGELVSAGQQFFGTVSRVLGPITRPPWEIGGKCKQRTSESNDDCEDDRDIPKHTTPQARSCTPSGFLK
jgi:hypothetical protein